MKLIRYQSPQLHTASAFNHLFKLGESSFDRVGSIFDDFFASMPTGYSQPAADFYEDDLSYFIQIELPGLKKDAVELELENGVLAIRNASGEGSDDGVSRSQFERSVSIPDDVDVEKVSAVMKDGVLTVTLPKTASAGSRQIHVD